MTVRETFRGYYPPTETELRELWQTALVVPDTNALLNLYKFPVAARDDMLLVLEAAKDRLWMPHHVAVEFHRQRESVIAAQLAVFDKVRSILGIEGLTRQLDALQLRKFHSVISVEAVLDQIRPALESFENKLSDLERDHTKPVGPDPIRDKVLSSIGSNVGPPFTQDDLDTLFTEGEKRYNLRVPPGFGDDKQKAKQPDFVHGGLMYRPRFGDLIVWKQLLRHAKENKVPAVIFLSDDEKPDWRHEVEHRGVRTLLPHPELVDEIRREAGVRLFFIYSSEVFLREGKERLGVKINENSIPQVSDVKEAVQASADPAANDPKLSLVNVFNVDGNRRDATLYCAHCGEATDLHFYEGTGVPKLREVLGLFHYGECKGVTPGMTVNLWVAGRDGDDSFFTWAVPGSRES